MSAHTPLVSIGLPVYNGGDRVAETIASLLDQDYVNIELIISCNASTDGTEAICRSVAGRDSRVRFMRQSENIGMGPNWHFVREQAQGPYFLWSAHDDLWSENCVSALVRALEDEPEAVLAFPSNYFVNDKREVVIDCNQLPNLAGPLPLLQRLDHVLWFEEGAQKGNLVHGLMRRAAADRVGDPTLETAGFGDWGGDQLIAFKMAFEGYFTHVPDAQFYKLYFAARRYDSDDLVEHYRQMQGYFARYRQIINESALDVLSKEVLLTSLAARETMWYCRVLNATSTAEFRARLGTIVAECDRSRSTSRTPARCTPDSFRDTLTSIVILNYNGQQHLRECLHSIERFTTTPYEVIVFDNASTDGSLPYLRTVDNITLVESPVNLGCPVGRSQAMSLARGDFVVLLDNDAMVTPDWLVRMLTHMKGDPQIGILGPRSNYVSGSQLVNSASYKNSYEMIQFAKYWSWAVDREQQQLVAVHRLVGFCMVIRRELIDKIGGCDPQFGKFGFEDDDFTLRALIAGYKAMIANDVFVHHTGGPQTKGDPEYNRELANAWGIFKRKWELSRELAPGESYNAKALCSQPFDSQRHFVPIPDPATVRPLIFDKGSTRKLAWQDSTHPHLPSVSDLVERQGSRLTQ